jgi:anti-sigma-K factor RskA
MTHQEMRDYYELYALGLLDSEEKQEIEEHLANACPECAAGMRRALETNAMFSALPPAVQPPKRLRKRVLASIGAAPERPSWSLVWGGVAACLALALVVVAGKWMGDLNTTRGELRSSNEQRNELRRELQASNTQLSTLQAALRFLNEPQTVQATFGGGEALPPTGRVFVNPTRGVLLIAAHLPPAPAGKTYEMWIVPKKGAPAPAGLFQSDAQGNAVHLLPGAVNHSDTAAIAVTVEPESGSAAPTTKPFIVAPLPTAS